MVAIFIGFLLIIYSANKKMLLSNIELLVHQRELNEQLEQFNQRLSIASVTDALTNLANRRYFQERLIADWIRAKRAKLSISLIMIDIDYFKTINDHYGHLYGDDCLKEIAKAISKATQRRTDLAARYGGDELIVILYNSSLRDTENFAKIYKNQFEV